MTDRVVNVTSRDHVLQRVSWWAKKAMQQSTTD
jgi:hypothetical protein